MTSRLTGLAAALAMLPLAACDKADVKICEETIVNKLQSPSSYKRIAVDSFDDAPMSLADFNKKHEITAPKEEVAKAIYDIQQRELTGHQIALRTVFIEFDVDNSFGTPIRGMAECAFRLVDGQIEDEDTLKRNASAANLRATMRTLQQLEGREADEAPRYDCCL